jgi:hypothetical protein
MTLRHPLMVVGLCDQVGRIVEYRDIDEERQLLRGGRSGTGVVGYV